MNEDEILEAGRTAHGLDSAEQIEYAVVDPDDEITLIGKKRRDAQRPTYISLISCRYPRLATVTMRSPSLKCFRRTLTV